MKCRYVCVMDVGPRSGQEDCILVENRVFQEESLTKNASYESDVLLLAVCDGMGGHDAGEEASRFVCDRLNDMGARVDFSGNGLLSLIHGIQNRSVDELPRGSGTTLAGILVKDGRVLVFNAGDSRVYRIGTKDITCVSRDHSLVQDLVDKGLIDEDDAFSHPYRNVVNFGIGPAFIKAVNRYDLHIFEEDILGRAVYLVCSDGVSDIIREKEILESLKSDPVGDVAALVRALRKNRLKDNTSFIIAEIIQ